MTPEDILERWRDEPLLFVVEALNAQPDEWQTKALNGLKNAQRLAVRSGHGVGKTAWLSWAILWWLCTRTPAKAIVLSASERQLKTITWPEVSLWTQRLPEPLNGAVKVEGQLIYLEGLKPQNFATQVVARRDSPEALQGFHSLHQLIIGDEASGIPDQTFITGEGSMSTKGAKVILCGNPTRVTGYFNDCFDRDKNRWFTMTVSSKTAKMVDPNWLRDMDTKYGNVPNIYRPRVLGLPPLGDDEALITRDAVNQAMAREVALSEFEIPVWGLDVARWGRNKTVLTKRRGNHLLEPQIKWGQTAAPETVGRVLLEWRTCQEKTPHLLPRAVKVDVIGLGGPIADYLERAGLPVDGVDVSDQKLIFDPDLSLNFYCKRDLLMWRVREWVYKSSTKLPNDDQLAESLVSPRFDFEKGCIKIETKKQMRSRGVASPDEFDSLALTFDDEDVVAPEHAIPDRYNIKTHHQPEGSWMSV